MRVSQLLLPTVKEDPAGAEAVSHKLMVRAGLVRQLAAGIYVYLPAGWRVMQKIEQIIREEMDAIGCQEMLMPVIQPAEIWQESGRWDAIGDEMFRLKDRKGADMALAMTHEEVVTWLAAREIHSYKQLPQMWYHIQTKERDEARPKSGILRTREFIMKDAYSLDVSDEALQESYRLHIGAYDRIYARCGLDCMMVEGDSGMMGGAISHEYMAYADAGEDEIVFCRECGYASNVETGVAGADPEPPASELAPHGAADAPFAKATGAPVDLLAEAELDTPDCKTIEQVATYLGLPARAFIKALVVVPEGGGEAGAGGAAAASGPVMVLVRGDHELGELKLRKALGAEFRMATRRRGARGPGRRARLRRPRADAAARVRRRGAAPGPLRRRRQQGRLPPQRRHARAGAAGHVRRPARRAPRRPVPAVHGRARGRARHRGRQHLPARPQVLRAHGRDVPGRGRQGAPHRHGQLRHRPGAHRRRRRRAAPRRQRHLLAGEHRAVPRAPGARARLGRRAARRSPTTCTRSSARPASRCSTTTAT